MLEKKLINFKEINPWAFFMIFIFFANFLFLFNSEWVLFITLILLFSFLCFYLIFFLKNLLKNEKFNVLNIFKSIIEEAKKNYYILNKINVQKINLIFFINNSISTFIANSVLYRCMEFQEFKNYIFNSIEDILLLNIQEKEFLFFNNLNKEELINN